MDLRALLYEPSVWAQRELEMWTKVLEWTRNCQLQSLLLSKTISWDVSGGLEGKPAVEVELKKVINLVLEHLRRGSNSLASLTIGGILLSEAVLESIVTTSTSLELFGFYFAGRDLVSHSCLIYSSSSELEE